MFVSQNDFFECIGIVTSYSLSQNLQISKSTSSMSYLLSEIQYSEDRDVFWSIQASSRAKVSWKHVLFCISPSPVSLQLILDKNCRYFVEMVRPIVSQHLRDDVKMPQVRVYLPLCQHKIPMFQNKSPLINSESIVFFSVTPSFESIYKALVSWHLQLK